MAGRRGRTLNLKNLRTFTSFKNSVFRLYYGAMLGQMAAMNMQMFARSLLVLRLTDSASALGVMALANAVPQIFFALFGGVMAERAQKKRILLIGQASSGLVSLAIALSLVTGALTTETWLLLVVASLAQGTIMGLMMPARQAIIADIVGGEQLMNAVALNTFGMNALRLLAPAAAGILVDLFSGGSAGVEGFASVYFAMTGLYTIAVGFVILMPNVGTVATRGRGALHDIVDGFRYILRDATILAILLITLLMVLFSMSYMFLLPVFSEQVLHVSASKLGFMIGISGAGAMAGSIVLASLPNKKRGAMLLGGGIVLGLALIGFALSGSYIVSVVMLIFVGLGQNVRQTLGNTLLQYYVKAEFRGRVMSVMMMEFGMTSFVVFFAGVITDAVGGRGTLLGVTLHGVQWTVGGLAVFLVLMSVAFLVLSRRVRTLD